MQIIPNVTETNGNITKSQDIFSRMLEDRIVLVNGEVADDMAQLLITQLLFLESQSPSQPILMYINSPGGSVTAGLAIIDTMNYVKCPVYTIGMGMDASMASVLLAMGEPGHRYVLPNTTIMIHQVLGGYKGQCTDMEIHTQYMKSLKEKLNRFLANSTNGKTSYEEMCQQCERDNFLTAEQALEMGLIDQIIASSDDIRIKNKLEEEEE